MCKQSVLKRSTQSVFCASARQIRLAIIAVGTSIPLGLSVAHADELVFLSPAPSTQTTSTTSFNTGRDPAGPEPTRRNDFAVSLGGSAWSGDFGSRSTTDIAAGLLSGQYNRGDWRLSATLPYTRIATSGDVFLGIGATPLIVRPQVQVLRRVNEGIGDLTLGASYLTHALPKVGVDIELLGGLKLPTASASSHVSTGQVDFSLGTEISKPIGSLVPFVSVVYRDFGSSASLPLRDGIATSVGTSYVFSSRLVANLSYDYARSASRFVGDAYEIVSSVSYKFPRSGIRLSSYASAGLSSGAPGVSGGLSLTRSF